MYCLMSARSTKARSEEGMSWGLKGREGITNGTSDVGGGEDENVIETLQLVYLGEESIHDLASWVRIGFWAPQHSLEWHRKDPNLTLLKCEPLPNSPPHLIIPVSRSKGESPP